MRRPRVLPFVKEQVRVFGNLHVLVIVSGSAINTGRSGERGVVRVLRLHGPDATETMVFEIFLEIEGCDLRVVDAHPSRGLPTREIIMCGHQGVIMATLCGPLVNHNSTQPIYGCGAVRFTLILLL